MHANIIAFCIGVVISQQTRGGLQCDQRPGRAAWAQLALRLCDCHRRSTTSRSPLRCNDGLLLRVGFLVSNHYGSRWCCSSPRTVGVGVGRHDVVSLPGWVLGDSRGPLVPGLYLALYLHCIWSWAGYNVSDCICECPRLYLPSRYSSR